ncbi:MAG: hypothetical protein DCC49_05010 [Acidobacteria bacterium]|nr:MAG: hypothetical protein DCC49_05010 [Acidobacteriota bacterium]
MLKPEDEFLHDPGTEDDWQESWYFNWADPEHDYFGLARIGYRPNAGDTGKIDGLILTIRNGKPEFVYPPVDVDQEEPWGEITPEEGLRAKRFTVTMEEPFKKWRLGLSGKDSMDLLFESFTPVFDFNEGERKISETMTAAHFEQSVKVTGWTEFKKSKIEVNGLGQRDKSWGVRAWNKTLGWNWISAQFSEDLTINVTQTFERPDGDEEVRGHEGAKRLDNGFVFNGGENDGVASAETEFTWAGTPHVMKSARTEVVTESGKEYVLEARALGHFPLVRSGSWLQETHCEFTLTDGDTKHEGYGMLEHVWRPSVIETVVRIPSLVIDAVRVLRR